VLKQKGVKQAPTTRLLFPPPPTRVITEKKGSHYILSSYHLVPFVMFFIYYSNIEEFCYYFKQLPSLENAKNNGRKVYQSRSLKELNDALMAEELRKILVSLTQGGSKGAISPESLFLVIWKIVPRFR